MPTRLLVNIDVPDLAAAELFYTAAFSVVPARRLGGAVELVGLDAPLYLIEQPQGKDARDYARHWTPVHLDIVVDDIDTAVARVIAAGATLEGAIRAEAYGRIATFGDPFGHGCCLIQFSEEGYDAIAA